jgi:hypothetical protein
VLATRASPAGLNGARAAASAVEAAAAVAGALRRTRLERHLRFCGRVTESVVMSYIAAIDGALEAWLSLRSTLSTGLVRLLQTWKRACQIGSSPCIHTTNRERKVLPWHHHRVCAECGHSHSCHVHASPQVHADLVEQVRPQVEAVAAAAAAASGGSGGGGSGMVGSVGGGMNASRLGGAAVVQGFAPALRSLQVCVFVVGSSHFHD